MKAERSQNDLSIYLTAEEVYSLQDGNIIGDRLGVVQPDAKIEIFPKSYVDEDDSLIDKYSDDRLTKALSSELSGKLYQNGDLQVIVPAISISDVRVTYLRLPREQIITPLFENEEYIKRTIPKDGVIVHLGGSLKVIDINEEIEI